MKKKKIYEETGNKKRGKERRGVERMILIFSNFLLISKLNFSSFIFAFFISCFVIYFLLFHSSVFTCFTFAGFSGVLRAGDGIYIPKGFFHYCATTSRSCSVNFWWLWWLLRLKEEKEYLFMYDLCTNLFLLLFCYIIFFLSVFLKRQ